MSGVTAVAIAVQAVAVQVLTSEGLEKTGA